MGPFEISKDLVTRLPDELLRALLRKLLEAEALRLGVSPSAIRVGGNQTAADGGVDALVDWKGEPKPTGWLPRRLIYFQCKAETMAAAALRDEMRPKEIVRPIFSQLAKERGAYIVFSTDDPSEKGFKARLEAMGDAISDVVGKEKILLDFYGADRIARWVNQHPGIAVWLLGTQGRALGGWRPYGDWSAPGSGTKPYLFDESSRATIDGVSVDMPTAIMTMRRALSSPGGAVRLVGISGMGKTRLAEALFDPAIDAANVLPTGSAIYGDAGLELSTGAALLTEQLAAAGVHAVVVVDNCTIRTHGQLVEIVSRPESRSSVLSIDYDVGDEKPSNTVVVRLGDNSEDVLFDLLEQRFPQLDGNARQHLAQFAGGNARIALKVAEGSQTAVNLAALNDTELLDRLFQTGRRDRDAIARRCADAAALVYAFYVAQADHQVIEHPTLAGIAGVTPEDFYFQMGTFLDWGIVQQRGAQRAVMPPPLANMLAVTFIRRADPDTLLSAFVAGPGRLFASFARRLGYLHEEPRAVAITQRLFGDQDLLGDPARLSGHGRQAFFNAAPGAPEAALGAIERSLSGPDAGQLVAIGSHDRRDFGELLAQIAHDPALFGRAMEALLPFVLAELGQSCNRSVMDNFLQRFWPGLSFTLADQPTRLRFIDRLLDDDRDEIRGLGVEALDHMLDAAHISSSMNLDFGARVLLDEWRPYDGEGWPAWVGAAFGRLRRVAASGEPEASRARSVIANHLREQLGAGSDHDPIAAMRAVRGTNYWDEGWNATNDALHFERATLSPEVLSDLVSLEKELRPRSAEDCFDAFVLGDPWRHWHPSGRENRSVRNVGRLARRVGQCLASAGVDLDPFVTRATNEVGQTSTYEFAQGLASRSAEFDQLWENARIAYEAAPDDSRTPAVLAGILKGAWPAHKAWVNERLDAALLDPLLAPLMVMLHTGMALDEVAMARFSRALAEGLMPPEHFHGLMYGGATKTVPADSLAAFLTELFAHEQGVLAALQVLHMRVFGDRSDKRTVAPELVALARNFVTDPRAFRAEHQRADHGLGTLTRLAMEADESGEVACGICRALASGSLTNRASYRHYDEVCASLRSANLRVVMEEIVGPGEVHNHLVSRFFGGIALNDDDTQQRVEFDEKVVTDWAREDAQNRAVRLAHILPYTRRDEATGLLTWSPLALELIEMASNPVAVLFAFEHRFFSGSGSGPISGRFVRRRPLVAAFSEHPERAVRNWAREAAERLEDSIQRWDERDRASDSRFE